jgi:hypothetical protein
MNSISFFFVGLRVMGYTLRDMTLGEEIDSMIQTLVQMRLISIQRQQIQPWAQANMEEIPQK